MKNVSRHVIADLYPLYVSGETSQDTRQLIEAILSQDPEFARALRESERNPLAVYAPPPTSARP